MEILGQYKSIIVPAPAGGVEDFAFADHGLIHGFYYAKAPAGESVAIIWACDYLRIAKKTSDVVGLGVNLYWDVSEKEMTITASGNVLIGRSILAAAAATDTVDMILWGLL